MDELEEKTNPSKDGQTRGGQAIRGVWDLVVGSFGLVGCTVLLIVPDLRDIQAWIIFGGAAGILPMSRLIDWLVTTGGKSR